MTTLLGARAVRQLLEHADADPVVLATEGPHVFVRDLAEGVRSSRQASDALRGGRAAEALKLRGPAFEELLDLHRTLCTSGEATSDGRVVVAHVGAPAPGMNAAVAAVVRTCLSRGVGVVGAQEGLRGLADGRLVTLDWLSVDGWLERGGANLGTNRHVPDDADVDAIRGVLRGADITGLVLVGGFEALTAAQSLRGLDLPLAVVPATISSNVPGTWRTVGTDTACNAIVEAVDRLRQSAVGARDRVFVIEVMGRRCGSLAATSGLGSGAELIFTHEDGVDLHSISRASRRLNAAFDAGRKIALVMVSDGVSSPYDARTIATMLEAEAGRPLRHAPVRAGPPAAGRTPLPLGSRGRRAPGQARSRARPGR